MAVTVLSKAFLIELLMAPSTTKVETLISARMRPYSTNVCPFLQHPQAFCLALSKDNIRFTLLYKAKVVPPLSGILFSL